MKELSIFVDESGHFGMKTKHSPYYIVSFVFHDQSNNITQSVAFFEEYLISNLTFKNATPRDYRLFQVADLLCTIKLTQEKYIDNGKLSRSEQFFFRNYPNFRKNYLSILENLSLN